MKSADKPTIFLLDLDVLNEAKWTWAQKRYNRACLEVSLLLHSGFKTSQYVDQDLNKR